MKYVTDKSHRDYFYKHGMIEFDNLCSLDQMYELNQAIDNLLCSKLSITLDKLNKLQPDEIFLQAHDLFRQDEYIKKKLLHKSLAEIAVELMEVRSLRMGYDQLLIGQSKPSALQTVYDRFLHQEGSLQDRSCLKPVTCGLLICLETSITSSDANTVAILPKKVGSAVFFKADIPLDLTSLSNAQGGRYLLVVYVDQRTVYILNEKDPHTHALKHIGYVFGDRLSDRDHPLLYRS